MPQPSSSVAALHAYPPWWLPSVPGYPMGRPFGRAEALDLGLTDKLLARLSRSGHLVHPLPGVYYAAQLADCLDLRLQCLSLVVPPDAVVTDRTAAWLLGAPMALAPGDHLVVPRVSIYRPPGYRLRNKLVDSGERMLSEADVMEVGGILVTVPLRTACDVGRLLHRDQAFAAMDCVIRAAGFSVAELVAHVERFRGYRGVVQLRELAPEVDPRSESPGESILRRRWRDCAALPVPELQIPVEGPDGVCFLDLGLPELRYAAEYDGLEWHGPERQGHDTRRREWIRRHGDYAIDVFTAGSVHGPAQDATERLVRGVLAAMRRRG